MKVLCIWEGVRSLPQERANNIRIALDRYPDGEFHCISRSKSFFCSEFKVIDWEDTVSEIEGFFCLKDVGKFISYIYFSDWARFLFLAQNPDTLYMDTDVKLLKKYDFDKEEKFLKPKNEICILYAPKNGAASNMVPILRKKLERRPVYRMLYNIGRRMDGDWHTDISRDYFYHWR